MVGPCEVLAIGAHPDDVELGCGATLARLASAGRRVAIVDLTAGEMASRGTVEERAGEAEAAARILGVAWRHCLGLPDGGVRANDPGQTTALVAVLRAARPRAVLMHDGRDPHPDHQEGAAQCRRAAFLAGVGRFSPGAGAPWRPSLLLGFAGPRQVLEPSLVVDVTACYEAKRRSLAAHASQFAPAADAGPSPTVATHLSSGFFLAAVEGRDRAAGNLIGCELGEGFVAVHPPSADDLAWLLGGVP